MFVFNNKLIAYSSKIIISPIREKLLATAVNFVPIVTIHTADDTTKKICPHKTTQGGTTNKIANKRLKTVDFSKVKSFNTIPGPTPVAKYGTLLPYHDGNNSFQYLNFLLLGQLTL